MLIRGVLPLLILHILDAGPNHGYQINKTITNISDGFFDFKEGTLYPTLNKMEKQGLVSSYQESMDGRSRRYYNLTDAGKSQLFTDLAEWNDFCVAVAQILDKR